MTTSSAMKWGLGAAALLGLGLAVAGSASAAQDDDGPAKELEDTGVRHGIRYEGCKHFELADPDALEAWGRSNALRFAKWLPKLDELRANPEQAIIEAMTLLFPECAWPPPPTTTFGPTRVGWDEAMVAAKEAAAGFDLVYLGPGHDPNAMAGSMLVRVLELAMRGQPMRNRRRRG